MWYERANQRGLISYFKSWSEIRFRKKNRLAYCFAKMGSPRGIYFHQLLSRKGFQSFPERGWGTRIPLLTPLPILTKPHGSQGLAQILKRTTKMLINHLYTVGKLSVAGYMCNES